MDRGQLKMIVEKSFNEHVTEHIQFTTLFGNMGCEPLLHLWSDYYPDLNHEFYVTMLYKIDKTLETIISIAKGVRIVLDRGI